MVRWWTRFRHLREEWLTREGSRRRRWLGGGVHRCWAGGVAGGTGASWRSSRTERWHWSARQGLAADGGFKRRCSLSSYQRPRTSGSGGGGWRLQLLRRWRTTTCTEGRRREVSGELGPVTARGRAAAGVESSATRRRTVQCGVGSASTVDGEARRSRGGRAHAVARAAALPSDSGRGSFGQRPLGPGYNRVCGNREHRPRQPIRARHAAA
jgi:hypothetical protein